jgi:hypothetical protein
MRPTTFLKVGQILPKRPLKIINHPSHSSRYDTFLVHLIILFLLHVLCSIQTMETSQKLLINKTNCFVLYTQSAKLLPAAEKNQPNHLNTKLTYSPLPVEENGSRILDTVYVLLLTIRFEKTLNPFHSTFINDKPTNINYLHQYNIKCWSITAISCICISFITDKGVSGSSLVEHCATSGKVAGSIFH